MTDDQAPRVKKYWRTAPALPQEVFHAWRKSNGAISPVGIVATVDPDGFPHTAPYGSLRAVAPHLLRLACQRDQDTYRNLAQDGRVTVFLAAPPDVAVSVRGRARVVQERSAMGEQFAFVEIEIEEVKNDMVRTVAIDSGIEISARSQAWLWFTQKVLREMEGME